MKSRTVTMLGLLVIAVACNGSDPSEPPMDDPMDGGTVVDDAGTATRAFCADVETSDRVSCSDFEDGTAAGWVPEGGVWEVRDGEYVGEIRDLTESRCGTSLMMTSMQQDVVGRDVRVELEMTSLSRVDKVVVLRERDPGNRVELNFRANFDGPLNGDLVVQELVDCEQFIYLSEFNVGVPHEVGQAIRAEIELVGDQLTVWVGDQQVHVGTYPFADQPGRVGVGVIEFGSAAFDNVLIEAVDGIE